MHEHCRDVYRIQSNIYNEAYLIGEKTRWKVTIILVVTNIFPRPIILPD